MVDILVWLSQINYLVHTPPLKSDLYLAQNVIHFNCKIVLSLITLALTYFQQIYILFFQKNLKNAALQSFA